MGTYDDIFYEERPPVPQGHPRMSLQSRAKLFSPFAALRGYDEKIEDENEKTGWITKNQAAGEEQEKIGELLSRIQKGDRITAVAFIRAEDLRGYCKTLTGTVRAIDPFSETLRLKEETEPKADGSLSKEKDTEILFRDLVSISFLSS